MKKAHEKYPMPMIYEMPERMEKFGFVTDAGVEVIFKRSVEESQDASSKSEK